MLIVIGTTIVIATVFAFLWISFNTLQYSTAQVEEELLAAIGKSECETTSRLARLEEEVLRLEEKLGGNGE